MQTIQLCKLLLDFPWELSEKEWKRGERGKSVHNFHSAFSPIRSTCMSLRSTFQLAFGQAAKRRKATLQLHSDRHLDMREKNVKKLTCGREKKQQESAINIDISVLRLYVQLGSSSKPIHLPSFPPPPTLSQFHLINYSFNLTQFALTHPGHQADPLFNLSMLSACQVELFYSPTRSCIFKIKENRRWLVWRKRNGASASNLLGCEGGEARERESVCLGVLLTAMYRPDYMVIESVYRYIWAAPVSLFRLLMPKSHCRGMECRTRTLMKYSLNSAWREDKAHWFVLRLHTRSMHSFVVKIEKRFSRWISAAFIVDLFSGGVAFPELDFLRFFGGVRSHI